MIKYYDRKSGNYEIEKVAGEKYLKWMYASPIGLSLLELLIKKKFFSRFYGIYCDTSLSARKINRFVSELDIDMSLCEKKAEEFKSFNDFFIRKLCSEARPINKNADALISPGDGRLTVFENIDLSNLVQVKGITYSLKALIGDEKTADKYTGGVCIILRLCPTDYHRFHFVDDGICGNTIKIKGSYYSVNSIALSKTPEVFCQNKREWCVFSSDNFGDILHVEVGATCVGTIIQTYTPGKAVSKGDEKGLFKFGGSTTILFFQKNKVTIDTDLLEQSRLGFETRVLMGEKIGSKFLKSR